MRRVIFLIAFQLLVSCVLCRAAVDLQGPVEVVISVADQRMAVLCEGGLVAKYPVSTSKFGAGDSQGSYRTPLGKMKVCDKIGEGLPLGAVIKHRSATGEVLQVNAPGRDPIVTRILWLEGLEEQNRNAKCRSIYIHGTPEENKIGQQVSWGCIRMRSSDVITLYDEVPVGTLVTIVAEKLPHYSKYVPHPAPSPTPGPELIASHTAAPAPATAAARPQQPQPQPQPATAAHIVSEPTTNGPHSHTGTVATIRWGDQSPEITSKAAAVLKQSILIPGNVPVVLTSRNARQPQADDHTRRQPAATAAPQVVPPAAEREQQKQATDPIFPSEKLSLEVPGTPVSFGWDGSYEAELPTLLLAYLTPSFEFAGFAFDQEFGGTAATR